MSKLEAWQLKQRRSEICIKCQKCCMEVQIPTSLSIDDDEAIDFYIKRGFNIYFPPNRKRFDIVVVQDCPQLTKEGCKIYKKRPKVCKEYNGAEDYGEDCRLSLD